MRALAPILLCAYAPLPAETLVLNDVRADVGVVFCDFTSRSVTERINSGVVVSRTTAEHDDDANDYRAGIQFITGTLGPAGGLIYGAQFADFRATFSDPLGTTKIDGPVIDALAGYGIAPLGTLHFELTPLAGVGYAFLDLHTADGHLVVNRSIYIEYGVRAAAYMTFDGCWQLGLELPYVVGRWRPKYGYTDATTGDQVAVEDKRTKDGGGVMLSLGVRF